MQNFNKSIQRMINLIHDRIYYIKKLIETNGSLDSDYIRSNNKVYTTVHKILKMYPNFPESYILVQGPLREAIGKFYCIDAKYKSLNYLK